MTTRQALTLTGLSAAALGLAFAAGRATAPRDRTEHTRQATATTQGEAQTTAKGSEAAESTRASQERSGEREEERRPDGTVRVVTRWKEGEVKERVVVKTVVEYRDRIQWEERIVEKERLVHVKAECPKPPRFAVAGGPAFSDLNATPDGATLALRARLIGNVSGVVTGTVTNDGASAALMLEVPFP